MHRDAMRCADYDTRRDDIVFTCKLIAMVTALARDEAKPQPRMRISIYKPNNAIVA
jgi:hypothetical protein